MVIEKRYNQEDLYKCDNDIAEIKACKNADTLFKVHRHTIGFVSGNKSNPLENIWFYANSNPTIKYKLPPQEAGFIVPKQYQETIMRVYIENKEQWDTIKEELL
jgi:hypothetical protein